MLLLRVSARARSGKCQRVFNASSDFIYPYKSGERTITPACAVLVAIPILLERSRYRLPARKYLSVGTAEEEDLRTANQAHMPRWPSPIPRSIAPKVLYYLAFPLPLSMKIRQK